MGRWWRVYVTSEDEPPTVHLVSSRAAAERWLRENVKAAHLTWDEDRRRVVVQM